MKTRWSWALLAAITMVSGALAAPVFAARGTSASGSGMLTINGEMRTFAFTVHEGPDGTVAGQAHVVNRSMDFAEHISLDCLRVVGNTAFVSGIVTKGDPLEGWKALFSVRDNGEGSNSPEDTITLVSHLPPTIAVDCHTPPPPSIRYLPIEHGNIEVRPST